MKIIGIIITVIGFFITGLTSLGINYAFYTAMEATKSEASAGIGVFAMWVARAQVLGYVNLIGAGVLFFGILALIAGLFAGRKK